MTSEKEKQEILANFKYMRSEMQALAEKIGDLESEREEHKYKH